MDVVMKPTSEVHAVTLLACARQPRRQVTVLVPPTQVHGLAAEPGASTWRTASSKLLWGVARAMHAVPRSARTRQVIRQISRRATDRALPPSDTAVRLGVAVERRLRRSRHASERGVDHDARP